jgi:hypothetical protein
MAKGENEAINKSVLTGLLILIVAGELGACATTTSWMAGTVTPSHLYLHKLPVSGVREPRITGYRCMEKPLFFRQDTTLLKQRGVIETLKILGKKNAVAEDVKGTLTTENRVFWTRQCVHFSATPVVAASPYSARDISKDPGALKGMSIEFGNVVRVTKTVEYDFPRNK